MEGKGLLQGGDYKGGITREILQGRMWHYEGSERITREGVALKGRRKDYREGGT